jgi:uncharacterized protein YjbI with pentapeptide repeats
MDTVTPPESTTRLYGDYTNDGSFSEASTEKKIQELKATINATNDAQWKSWVETSYQTVAEDLKYLAPYDGLKEVELFTKEVLSTFGGLGKMFLLSWIDVAKSSWDEIFNKGLNIAGTKITGAAAFEVVREVELDETGKAIFIDGKFKIKSDYIAAWQPSEQYLKKMEKDEIEKSKPKLNAGINRITSGKDNQGPLSFPRKVAGMSPSVQINLKGLFTDPDGGKIRDLRWYKVDPNSNLNDNDEVVDLSTLKTLDEQTKFLNNIKGAVSEKLFSAAFDLINVNSVNGYYQIPFILSTGGGLDFDAQYKNKWIMFECQLEGKIFNSTDVDIISQRFLIEVGDSWGGSDLVLEESSRIQAVAKVKQNKYVTLKKQALDAFNNRSAVEVDNFNLVRLDNVIMRQYGFGSAAKGYYEAVNFTGGDLKNADLTDCTFNGCNFNAANLNGCIITRTKFTNCEYNDKTIWPRGFGSVDIEPDYYTEDNTANPVVWKLWKPHENETIRVDEPGYKVSDPRPNVDLTDAEKANGIITRSESVSLNTNFQTVWGNPFVENATGGGVDRDYYTIPNWFTLEQAMTLQLGSNGVTVTPLMAFLADKRNTQTYDYGLKEGVLEEHFDKKQQYIKKLMLVDQNIEKKSVTIIPKTVLDARSGGMSTDYLSVDNIDSYKGVFYNLIFTQERNRDLRAKVEGSYDYLVDFGKSFEQNNRYTLTREMVNYLKFLELPAFRRDTTQRQKFIESLNLDEQISGVNRIKSATDEGEDPFACCGNRFAVKDGYPLEDIRSIDFEGSSFGSRDWKLTPSIVAPGDSFPLSTRIYPFIFSGSVKDDNTVDYMDLQGTSFKDCDLKGCIFRYCDLRNTNFSGAKLSNAVFADNLYGHTNFDGIDAAVDTIAAAPTMYGYSKVGKMSGAAYFLNTCDYMWKESTLDDESRIVEMGSWVPQTSDSTNTNIRSVSTKDHANMFDLSASFVGADIRGCRFANIKMNCDFKNVQANWVELTNAVFAPSRVENSAFKNMWVNNNGTEPKIERYNKDGDLGMKGADIFPTGLPVVFITAETVVNTPTPWQLAKYGAIDLRNLDFSPGNNNGKELSELNFNNLLKRDFTNSVFNTCDLSGLNLKESIFVDCSFNNCDFTNTELAGTYFNRSDIIHCLFDEADMRGVVVDASDRGKDIKSANFGGTDLSGTTFKNCYMKETNPYKSLANQLKGVNFRGDAREAPEWQNIKKMQTPDDYTTTYGDGRLTQLKGTKIFWEGDKGAEILQRYTGDNGDTFVPVVSTSAEALQPNGVLKQYIWANRNSAYNPYAKELKNEEENEITWPFGLRSEFNKVNREPNNSERQYNTPKVISQMIEGLRNVSNLTIADGENNFLSIPNIFGSSINGIVWDPNDTHTSRPIDFEGDEKLIAVESNISDVNFNGCDLGDSNFENVILDADKEVSFKKITSDGMSFKGAQLLGKANFNDSKLINVDFTDAKITYGVARSDTTSFSLLETYNGSIINEKNTSMGKWGRSLIIDGENNNEPIMFDKLRIDPNLTGAKFIRTELTRFTDFEHAILDDATFEDVIGLGGTSEVNYGNRLFTAITANNLTMKSTLSENHPNSLDMKYSSIVLASVTNSTLVNINFDGADLRQTNWQGTTFNNCDLRNTKFDIFGFDTGGKHYDTWVRTPSSEANPKKDANGVYTANGLAEIAKEKEKRQKWLQNVDLKTSTLGNTSFKAYKSDELKLLEWPVGYYVRLPDPNKQGSYFLTGGIKTDGSITLNTSDTNTISNVVQDMNQLWKLQAYVMDMKGANFFNIDKNNNISNLEMNYLDLNIGGPYVTNSDGTGDHWADVEAIQKAMSEFPDKSTDNEFLANKRVHRGPNTTTRIDASESNFFLAEDKQFRINRCVITSINFTSANMRKIKLTNTLFYNCVFDKANMTNVDIDNCCFIECSFKETNFSVESINDSKINNSSFYECNFGKAKFVNVILKNCSTSRCQFNDQCSFTNTQFIDFAIGYIPENVSISQLLMLRRNAAIETEFGKISKGPIYEKAMSISKKEFEKRIAWGDIYEDVIKTADWYKKLKLLDSTFNEQNPESWITVNNESAAVYTAILNGEDPTSGDVNKLEIKINQEKAVIHYYQSDFHNALINNCWFKNFSAQGKTQDIRDVKESLLPPGFRDKLFNNQPDYEGSPSWDISGNNERAFMYLAAEQTQTLGFGETSTKFPVLINYLDEDKFTNTEVANYQLTYVSGANNEEVSVIKREWKLVPWLSQSSIQYFKKDKYIDGGLTDHGVGRGGKVRIVILEGNVVYNYETKNFFQDLVLPLDSEAVDGPTNLERLRSGIRSLKGISFRRVDMDNIDLPSLSTATELGADDGILDLRNSNFSEASMRNTDLAYANLDGTNFSGANLTGSNFFQATLTNCNFDGAILTDCNLIGANLSGSKFKDALIGGILVSGSYGYSKEGLAYKYNAETEAFENTIVDATIFDSGDNKTTFQNVVVSGDAIVGVAYSHHLNNKKSKLLENDAHSSTINSGANNDSFGSALWPKGLHVEPLTIEEEGVKDSIKKVGTTLSSSNSTAMDKMRSGVDKLGGEDFGDYKPRGNWEWLGKGQFFNILLNKSKSLENKADVINQKIVPRWLPSNNKINYDDEFKIWYTNLSYSSGTDGPNGDIRKQTQKQMLDIDDITIDDKLINLLMSSGTNIYVKDSETGKYYVNQDYATRIEAHYDPDNINPHGLPIKNAIPSGSTDSVWLQNLSNDGSVGRMFDFSSKDGETRTKLDGANIIDVFLPNTDMRNVGAVASVFSGSILRNSDFSGADLTDAVFASGGPTANGGAASRDQAPYRTDLTNCNFANATCVNTHFDDCDMAHCDFSGSNLDGATFFQCNLYKADFTNANLGANGICIVGAGPWSSYGNKGTSPHQTVGEHKVYLTDNTSGHKSARLYPIYQIGDEKIAKLYDPISSNPKTAEFNLRDENDKQLGRKLRPLLAEVLPKFNDGHDLLYGMGFSRDASSNLYRTYAIKKLTTGYVPVDDVHKTNGALALAHAVDGNGYVMESRGLYRITIKGPTVEEQYFASWERTLSKKLQDMKDKTIDVGNANARYKITGSDGQDRLNLTTSLTDIENLKDSQTALKKGKADGVTGDALTNLEELVSENLMKAVVHGTKAVNDNGNPIGLHSYENVDLSGVDFTRSYLHVDFSGAKLTNVIFEDCDLTNCSFKNVKSLTKVSFVGANLTGVDFTNVELDGDVKFSNLNNKSPLLFGVGQQPGGVETKDAHFDRTIFKDASGADHAVFPGEFDISGAILVDLGVGNNTIRSQIDGGKSDFNSFKFPCDCKDDNKGLLNDSKYLLADPDNGVDNAAKFSSLNVANVLTHTGAINPKDQQLAGELNVSIGTITLPKNVAVIFDLKIHEDSTTNNGLYYKIMRITDDGANDKDNYGRQALMINLRPATGEFQFGTDKNSGGGAGDNEQYLLNPGFVLQKDVSYTVRFEMNGVNRTLTVKNNDVIDSSGSTVTVTVAGKAADTARTNLENAKVLVTDSLTLTQTRNNLTISNIEIKALSVVAGGVITTHNPHTNISVSYTEKYLSDKDPSNNDWGYDRVNVWNRENITDFTTPDLRKTTYHEKINITGVDFGRGDLSGADFTGLDVTDVNFSQTDISNTIFKNIKNAEKATWPYGFNYDLAKTKDTGIGKPTLIQRLINYPKHSVYKDSLGSMAVQNKKGVISNIARYPYLLAEQDLRKLDLSGIVLYGMDVSGATMQGSILDYADCRDVKFTDTVSVTQHSAASDVVARAYGEKVAKQSDGIKGCSFLNADLSGADFSGCNVQDCDFRFANIVNTNFTAITQGQTAQWPAGAMIKTDGVTGGVANGERTSIDYNSVEYTKGAILGHGHVIMDGNTEIKPFRWQSSDINASNKWWSYRPLNQREGNQPNVNNFGFKKNLDSTLPDIITRQTPNMTRFRTGGYNLQNISTLVDLSHNKTSKNTTILQGIDFMGTNFTNSDLSYSSIRWCNFKNCNLTGVDLSHAEIHGDETRGKTIFDGSTISTVGIFQEVSKLEKSDTVDTVTLDLSNASFCSFNNMNLQGLLMKKMYLLNSEFKNSNLVRADFTDSWLQNVDFTGSDLSGAIFTNAVMENCNFDNCHFVKTNFLGVRGLTPSIRSNLRDNVEYLIPNSDNKIGDGYDNDHRLEGMVWPKGLMWDLTNGSSRAAKDFDDVLTASTSFEFETDNMVKRLLEKQEIKEIATKDGNGVYTSIPRPIATPASDVVIYHLNSTNKLKGTTNNFTTIDLSGSKLVEIDMTDGHFNTTILVNADLSGSTLKNARFTNGINSLDGSKIDGDADMVKSNLSHIDLKKTRTEVDGVIQEEYVEFSRLMDEVSMHASDLSGALFYNGTSMKKVTFLDSSLNNIEFGQDIEYKVDGVKTSRVDLSGATFKNNLLLESDFKDANLTGVTFENVDVSATKFNNVTLMDKVTFKNCDISGIFGKTLGSTSSNITSMKGARFDTVKMHNIIFGADLTGSTFDTCDLSGTDFSEKDKTNVEGRFECDLSGVQFISGTIVNVDFTGLNMTGVKLTSAELQKDKDCSLNDITFVNADLTGTDFSGSNLKGCNFTGATLNETIFTDVSFANVIFGENIKLKDATLDRVDLNNRSLVGADLRDASLNFVEFHNTDLSGADLRLGDGNFGGNKNTKKEALRLSLHGTQGVNLAFVNMGSDASLNDIDLSGVKSMVGFTATSSNLKGIDLSGVDLRHANLSNSDLSGAILTRANLSHANLTGCDLSGANLYGATLFRTTLDNAIISWSTDLSMTTLTDCSMNNLGGDGLKNKDLRLNKVANLRLREVNLSNAILSRQHPTPFSEAGLKDLQKVINDVEKDILKHSLLAASQEEFVGRVGKESVDKLQALLDTLDANTKVTFGENLGVLDLSGSTLTNVDLSQNVLAFSNFRNTDMNGVDLSGAVIVHADFSHLSGLKGIHAKTALSKQIGLLSNVNFSHSDLSLVDLSGIRTGVLKDVSFNNCDLSGANFTGLTLDNVDFTNADLSDCDFSGATINPNCILKNADVGRINIALATLTGVDFSETKNFNLVKFNTNPKNLDRVHFGSNMSNLKGGILHGMNVTDGDLSGVDLSGSDLSGSRFVNCDFTDANMTDASLNFVTFRSCNLSDVSFNHADCSGTDFMGTKDAPTLMRRADLSNVLMSNVKFSYTNMFGVIHGETHNIRRHIVPPPDVSGNIWTEGSVVETMGVNTGSPTESGIGTFEEYAAENGKFSGHRAVFYTVFQDASGNDFGSNDHGKCGL